eukprot:6203385-Pleurochrysis_carterae.AAC.1
MAGYRTYADRVQRLSDGVKWSPTLSSEARGEDIRFSSRAGRTCGPEAQTNAISAATEGGEGRRLAH